MEKETKRTLLRILDTMQEQQSAIRALQISTAPSTRSFKDGIAERIERIAQEVRGRECFTLDWTALCDKGWATRDSTKDEPFV